MKSMSTFIPNKMLSVRKSLRWITPQLLGLFRRRASAHKRAKSTNRQGHWAAFRKLRNKATSALREAKLDFFRDLSMKLRTPKQFWSSYHSMLANRQRLPPLLTNGATVAESSSAKANLLNSHFVSSFSTAPVDAASFSCTTCELSSVRCTSEDVLGLIRSLKTNSASGPDNISSQMLKGAAPSICGHLADLFNRSLSSGVIPTDWKTSNITPVFKAGDPKLTTNYRPISLLSIPSKILERIVHNRLMTYLSRNNLLSSLQFGFRPKSSTQEAVLAATNDWHQHLDSNNEVACVFFDLSKAFDTLPHHLITANLQRVGVCGPLLRWFTGADTGL